MGRNHSVPFRPEIKASKRNERLQVMLSDVELKIIDAWRFENKMPSRAATIRALVRIGLESTGMDIAAFLRDIDGVAEVAKSDDIGIV